MSSERTSNRELHGQLAQSLNSTVDHDANETKANDHGTGASSCQSCSRANEQSSTDRSTNGNHLEVTALETLGELVGLLDIGAVCIAVRSDLAVRLDMGERLGRPERIDKASEASTARRLAIVEARAVVGGRSRDVLARVTQLCIHGGDGCEEGTPVQPSSDDVNMEEALVLFGGR
jgi:hypothetical protein